MTYTKYREAWENAPSTETPISAEALDHIESGVAEAHELVDQYEPDPAATAAAVGSFLELNANQITGGTLPLSRIPASIARTSEIPSVSFEDLAGEVSGVEGGNLQALLGDLASRVEALEQAAE